MYSCYSPRSHLRSMPATSINYDHSLISQDQRSKIMKQIEQESQILQFQEIDKTLQHCLSDSASFIQGHDSINSQTTSSQQYFINYYLITKILEKNMMETQYLLQEMDDDRCIPPKAFLYIESITKCMQNIIQHSQTQQFDSKEAVQRVIILDCFYSVACHIIGFIASYSSKIETQLQYQLMTDVLKTLRQLLSISTEINSKDQKRINNVVYQYLMSYVSFIRFIQSSNIPVDNEILKREYQGLFQLFQQIFLQSNKSYDELSKLENKSSIQFIEVYLINLKVLYTNEPAVYTNFLNNLIKQYELEFQQLADRHYYCLHYQMIAQYYYLAIDRNEINIFLKSLSSKQEQLYSLIQHKQELVSQLFTKLFNLSLNQNPLQQIAKQWLNSIDMQYSNEVGIDIKIQYHETIWQSLLHINSRYQSQYSIELLNEYIDSNSPIIVADFMQFVTNQILNVNYIRICELYYTFVCKFYMNFQNHNQDIYKSLITYLTAQNDGYIIYRKLNKSLIFNFQELEDKQLYFLIMSYVVQNANNNGDHIQQFMTLMEELINCQITQLDQDPLNVQNLQILVFYIKILNMSCMSTKDQYRLLKVQGSAQYDTLIAKLFVKDITHQSNLMDGNLIINYFITHINQLQCILKAVYSLFIENDISGLAYIMFNIQQELSFLFYQMYWNVPQRENLQLVSIQSESLNLFDDFYRFTILTCCNLKSLFGIESYIYSMVNSSLVISYGQEYSAQIIQSLFYDLNLEPIQDYHNLHSKVIDHLSINMTNLNVVYNKYFELAFSILFEATLPGIDNIKQFYLNLLNYLLDVNLQMLLTFQELLPKFIFYFRIERNPEIIHTMKNCVIKVLTINSDSGILKALFETMSINQSSILKICLPTQYEDLDKAYQIASIPQYTIPIFSNKQNLSKLVDEAQNYKQILATMVEIILRTLKQVELRSKDKHQKILHFQGSGAHLSVSDVQLKSESFIVVMQLKCFNIPQNDNNNRKSFMLDESAIDQDSLVVNMEQMLLLIIEGDEDEMKVFLSENHQQQQTIIIKYTIKQKVTSIQFTVPKNLQLFDWHYLSIINNRNSIQVYIDEYQLLSDKDKQISLQIRQIKSISIGSNQDDDSLDFKPNDNRFQSMSKSFLNLSFLSDQFSFTGICFNSNLGQIQNFYIMKDTGFKYIKENKFHKIADNKEELYLQLNLSYLDLSQPFYNKPKFINSQFLLEKQKNRDVNYFTKYNQNVKTSQLFCFNNLQNVYVVDVNSFLDLLIRNGSFNLFYMLVELLLLIDSEEHTQLSDDMNESIVINIISIIKTMLDVDTRIREQFIDKGQETFMHIITLFVAHQKCFSDKLFQIISDICNSKDALKYYKTYLQMLDNQYITPSQVSIILKKLEQGVQGKMKEILDLAQAFSQKQVKDGLTHLSNLIASTLLLDVGCKVKSNMFFISHSLTQCNADQVETCMLVFKDFTQLNFVLNFIKEQPISYLTFDILQILNVYFSRLPQQHLIGLLSETKSKGQQQTYTLDSIVDCISDLLAKYLDPQLGFHRNKQDQIMKQYSKLYYDRFVEQCTQLIYQLLILQNNNEKCILFSQAIGIIQNQLKNSVNQLGEFTILMLFRYFKQYSLKQHGFQHSILNLINCLYQNQLMDDNTKDKVSNLFADLLKKCLSPYYQDTDYLEVFIKYEHLAKLIQNLVPSQTIETKSNYQKQSQNKNKSLEIFTYILTYIFERTDSILYQINSLHFPILNKDTLQLFLQITFETICYLLSDIMMISENQQKLLAFTKEPAKKLRILNLVTALHHIELCMQMIDPDYVQWAFYAKVIEKSMDIFSYLNLLFFVFEEQPHYKINGPFVMSVDDKTYKTSRIMPNGGLTRLYLQLSLPYLQMKEVYKIIDKLLKLYIELILHRNGRKSIVNDTSQMNMSFNQIFAQFQPLLKPSPQVTAIQEIGASKPLPKRQYCFDQLGDIIIYSLLDYILQENDENREEIMQIVKLLKDSNLTTKIHERALHNSCLIKSSVEQLQNLFRVHDILQSYNHFSNSLVEIKRISQKRESIHNVAEISYIFDGSTYEQKQFLFKILNLYAFRQFELTNRLWTLINDQRKNSQNMQDISMDQAQASIKSNTSQRSASTADNNPKQTFNSISSEEQWAKMSFELKLKNSLWYFHDDNLQPLYTELNNFIQFGEFDQTILDQVQIKFKITHLEDSLRRRSQLLQIRIKNANKPYLKNHQQSKIQSVTVLSSRKTMQMLDSSNERSPLNKYKVPSNDSPLFQLQSNPIDESNYLTQSLSIIQNRRSSIKKKQLIQVEQIQNNLRKESTESNMSQDNQVSFDCEYITQEGGIFGEIMINKYTIVFKMANHPKPQDSKYRLGCFEMMTKQEDIMLVFQVNEISKIFTRRYLLFEIAIEIVSNNRYYFINLFNSQNQLSFMKNVADRFKIIECIQDRRDAFNKAKYKEAWKDGKMSNFQYLMLVNTYSGRSFNDLSQYFVFPWVLSDYFSQCLDLENSNIFRNLGQPIGTLDNQRFQQTLQRFQSREKSNMDEYMMHGSHYSHSTIIYNYLLRLEPFNDLHFALQKNKFDVADRLFSSIQSLWETSKWQDTKELIPEFYYMPEFLQNINSFDFGKMQSNIQVADVQLPRWVRTKTAEEFVYLMRQALECDKVSQKLNEWIDLIFGVKSFGDRAEKANNLFHYLTYEENAKKLDRNDDTFECYLQQINCFGQTPFNLFTSEQKPKEKNILMYQNKKPIFSYKACLFKQDIKIISVYFFEANSFYILLEDFTMLYLTSESSILHQCATKQMYKQAKRIMKLNTIDRDNIKFEINISHCNYQNMFTYINFEQQKFQDNIDSQYHSNISSKNELYFAVGGFGDNSFAIWNLSKGKLIKSIINHTKKVSCMKFHSYKGILVVGSLDGQITISQCNLNQKNIMEINDKPSQIIVAHKTVPIISIDIHDIYILSVDLQCIAYVHTYNGEQLHQITLQCDSPISQCIIHPAQFFIFKTKKSQLHVYTYTTSQYLVNCDLHIENSSNIVFLSPCSSVFIIHSEDSDIIQMHDIFDLKVQQQTFIPKQRGMLDEVNLKMLLENNKTKQGKDMPIAKSCVTAFNILLTNYQIQEPQCHHLNYFIFCAMDGALYLLADQLQQSNELFNFQINNAGVGKNRGNFILD